MNSENHLKPRTTPDAAERMHYYSLSDGDESTSRVSIHHPSRYARWRIQREEARVTRSTHESDTEPTPEMQALYNDAREFVEAETGYDLSDVELLRTILNESNGMIAGYNQMSDTIQIFKLDLDKDDPLYEYDKECAAEVLVHELMHATAIGNLKVLNVCTKNRPRNVAVSAGQSSFDMRHAALENFIHNYDSDIRLGQFFEEGFADEGAARWREHKLGKLKGTQSFSVSKTPSLPHRFITLPKDCGIDINLVAKSAPVYAAAGLYFLSAYTHVDIYDLMIQARDPAREAEAKRKIIATIEGVKKGLYAKLRDAPYSNEGFASAYQEVIDVINKNIDAKQALGKIATTE